MEIALFSDIHANLTAFDAVVKHCFNRYGKEIPIIHIGDCIDYGMRPNEVIERMYALKEQMLANIKGNHEAAILGVEANRFSSDRGYKANLYTKTILKPSSWNFIKEMQESSFVLRIADKNILVVHGDLSDVRWGKMIEKEKLSEVYDQYDYVISGHTHISSLFYKINKETHKKTIFINPGSIGQPRNCNINAQYAILNIKTGAVDFEAIPYDYGYEQSLYNNSIDDYYKRRLSIGI